MLEEAFEVKILINHILGIPCSNLHSTTAKADLLQYYSNLAL